MTLSFSPQSLIGIDPATALRALSVDFASPILEANRQRAAQAQAMRDLLFRQREHEDQVRQQGVANQLAFAQNVRAQNEEARNQQAFTVSQQPIGAQALGDLFQTFTGEPAPTGTFDRLGGTLRREDFRLIAPGFVQSAIAAREGRRLKQQTEEAEKSRTFQAEEAEKRGIRAKALQDDAQTAAAERLTRTLDFQGTQADLLRAHQQNLAEFKAETAREVQERRLTADEGRAKLAAFTRTYLTLRQQAINEARARNPLGDPKLAIPFPTPAQAQGIVQGAADQAGVGAVGGRAEQKARDFEREKQDPSIQNQHFANGLANVSQANSKQELDVLTQQLLAAKGMNDIIRNQLLQVIQRRRLQITRGRR